MKLRLSVILALLLLMVCNLFAQIDKNITYQGILKNNDGSVVTDDDYSITFKLYEGESGGTEIWTETQTIATSNGLFSVYLGNDTELNISFDKQYWLGITVASGSEMTPRTKIVTSPYSIFASSIADNTVTADKITDSTITLAKLSTDGASSGQTIMYDGSNIVWGTASGSGFSLPYNGASDSDSTLFKITGSGEGKVIYGKTTGTGTAGYFEIANASSSSPALNVKTSGTGLAGYFDGKLRVVDSLLVGANGIQFADGSIQTTAMDTLTLPYTGTVSGSQTAFKIETSGSSVGILLFNRSEDTYAAGFFNTDHDNPRSTVYIESYGKGGGIKVDNRGTEGNAGEFINDPDLNPNYPALKATSLSGWAAHFQGWVSIIDTLIVSTRGIKFQDGTIQTSAAGGSSFTLPYQSSTSSSSTLMDLTNTGTGRAGSFEINNSSNDSSALYVSTNGSGTALRAVHSGGGTSALIEANTTGSAEYAVRAYQYGYGGSGYFRIYQLNNYSNAINAYHDGMGGAGLFRIDNTSNNQNAVTITTNGTGDAMRAEQTGTGGNAGEFHITGSTNSDAAIKSVTAGKGSAGYFQISNSSNDSSALYLTTNGTGKALSAISTGGGTAAYIEANSTGSAENGLRVDQKGVGGAIYTQIYNTDNNRNVISASTNGMGAAGIFKTENTSNSQDALTSSTWGSGSAFRGINYGTGIAGEFSNNDSENTAVVISATSDGTGHAGYFYISTSGSTGDAVHAETDGDRNAGKFIVNKTTNGYNAVEGQHYGTGTAIRGTHWGTSGSAGFFYIDHASNASAALKAETNGTGYAGHFVGNVYVEGILSKSAGSFAIDHPLDPENKILRHSFVESPEMMNIYKGRAKLENGKITIDLPDYFDALNHPDTREIVLTCVDGWSPLFLDGKIEKNKFTVKTTDIGDGTQEFSWVIYAVRNDDYAKENPIIVEEEKGKLEKGTRMYRKNN